MPNKYEVSFILIDNYEEIDGGDSPLELDEIKFNAEPQCFDVALTIENFLVKKVEE